MRSFAGIDLGTEPVPDETTVCKFRHLLERSGMGKILLEAMNTYLRENGIKIGNSTIVDATIISAPRLPPHRKPVMRVPCCSNRAFTPAACSIATRK